MRRKSATSPRGLMDPSRGSVSCSRQERARRVVRCVRVAAGDGAVEAKATSGGEDEEEAEEEGKYRYKLVVAYDGGAYYGWQLQVGRPTSCWLSTVAEKVQRRAAIRSRRVHSQLLASRAPRLGKGEGRGAGLRRDVKLNFIACAVTQRQAKQRSVQEQLESAVSRVTRDSRRALRMAVAGRTDRGVHAAGQARPSSLLRPPSLSFPANHVLCSVPRTRHHDRCHPLAASMTTYSADLFSSMM